jgi:hypothetical protein
VLTSIEKQIDRLLMLVANGADRLDYVIEKVRPLEVDVRMEKAELHVLRSTKKRPLRRITPSASSTRWCPARGRALVPTRSLPLIGR